MLVTILGRMHGVSASYEGAPQFSDVGASSYYSGYVAWAAEAGIVQGTGNGLFRPDRHITRQEIAVILGNYINFAKLQLPQNVVAEAYQDEQDIAAWAKSSVTLLLQAGLLNGKEGNRLDSLGTATRAETVKLIALLDEWSNK
ncbi:S-layer homology domain-containing protein [Paenibacillus sp. CAU 1782]